MQNDKLPNSALSASSQYNGNTGPENARLHFYADSGRRGAWVAQKQDHNQWLQVDFGVETVITRIATQGRQDADQWVKEYTLRYSTDGSYFKHYQPFGYTKVTFCNSTLVRYHHWTTTTSNSFGFSLLYKFGSPSGVLIPISLISIRNRKSEGYW